MSQEPFSLSIRDLGGVGDHWQRKVMPDDALHYIPPSGGSWEPIRTALLLPESVLLMVAPLVCGRICSLHGLQGGYRKRFFVLGADESEMVTGRYLDKIPGAVAEILAGLEPKPKVLLLCSTCVDDLLGSDYDGIARRLGQEHGLLVRAIHMKPSSGDGRRPSGMMTQLVTYDLLEPTTARDAGVNVLGTVVPIDEGSEFHDVMAAAGVGPIRHIATCATLDEFRQMSRARLNLMVRQRARLAVEHLERKLGIPYCYAPPAFGLEAIAATYHSLSEHLEVPLVTARYRDEAEAAIAAYRAELGGLSIAVSSSANAEPFELARALIEYGFDVRYVFTNALLDLEVEHVEWLKGHAPDLVVFTNSHTSMASFVDLGVTVDLAVGFGAGYYCSGAKTVPLLPDRQPYGYRGVVYLLEQMAAALRGQIDLHEAIDRSFVPAL